MSVLTWVTMVAVISFVWGGFLLALRAAVLKESREEPGEASTQA